MSACGTNIAPSVTHALHRAAPCSDAAQHSQSLLSLPELEPEQFAQPGEFPYGIFMGIHAEVDVYANDVAFRRYYAQGCSLAATPVASLEVSGLQSFEETIVKQLFGRLFEDFDHTFHNFLGGQVIAGGHATGPKNMTTRLSAVLACPSAFSPFGVDGYQLP